jgi:hypothetical protein
MEPIDYENRLRLGKLVLKEAVKRDQSKKQRQTSQPKKEEGMLRFWISEDESIQLDNMTVRALAENPEATRAFFDNYGVLLTDENEVLGIRDYSIVKNSTTSTTYDESHDADDMTCQYSC